MPCLCQAASQAAVVLLSDSATNTDSTSPQPAQAIGQQHVSADGERCAHEPEQSHGNDAPEQGVCTDSGLPCGTWRRHGSHSQSDLRVAMATLRPKQCSLPPPGQRLFAVQQLCTMLSDFSWPFMSLCHEPACSSTRAARTQLQQRGKHCGSAPTLSRHACTPEPVWQRSCQQSQPRSCVCRGTRQNWAA